MKILKNLKPVLFGLSWIIILWLVVAFNPIINERDWLVASINNEITMLENQMLDNKDLWQEKQSEIKEIQEIIDFKREEQKVFQSANEELRKQKMFLIAEKGSLGLN